MSSPAGFTRHLKVFLVFFFFFLFLLCYLAESTTLSMTPIGVCTTPSFGEGQCKQGREGGVDGLCFLFFFLFLFVLFFPLFLFCFPSGGGCLLTSAIND